MSGKKIAYIRVSSKDQNPVSQLPDIQVDKRFVEYASAKDTNRPVLKEMLNYIRDDDEIFVHRIDRLARNVKELLELVNFIRKKSVTLNFVKEGLTFNGNNSAMDDVILTMLATFAEFERRISRERQQEGIEAAKARGAYKGRKPALNQQDIELMKNMLSMGYSKQRTARELGVTPPTIYKYLKQ